MTNTNATPALEYCLALAPRSDRWEAEAELRALMAESDRLRAALDDCASRARRIMGSIGYQDDDNSAWIGPDMHAIVDHANRAEMRESTAREGVKP